MGASALGGDISSAATLAASRNLAAAGVGCCVNEWDARALPLATGGAHVVVTNLPWGSEVEVDSALQGLYCRILREIERTLTDGGRAVVLADAPEHLDVGGLRLEEQFEISLYGRTPTVSVLAH